MTPLVVKEIRQALPGPYKAMDIVIFEEVDSTNNAAKRGLTAGCALPALFLAERQSAGRGRQGKHFFSPADSGLYMSLALPPMARPESAVSLTTMAAVATARAIRAETGLCPRIKWVNDLYLEGRKICGILAEGTAGGLVLGIGVNVGRAAFPAELAATAASLDRPELDRNRLAAGIAAALLDLAGKPEDKSYMADYRAWSIVLGQRVIYGRGGLTRCGLAREIEDDGGLVVDGPEGMEVLRSGEISLRVQTKDENQR